MEQPAAGHPDGPGPGTAARASRLLAAARALAVLTMALTASLAGVLLPSPALAADDVPGWRWPLAGRPTVVRAFDPPAAPWAPGHRGVDLRAPRAAVVVAAGRGRVAFAGIVARRGVVSVAHAGGLRTTYEPVDARVRSGDLVAAGDVLGTLGTQGAHCLPDPCLHWGLRRGETYLDPLSVVGESRPVRLLPVWDRAPVRGLVPVRNRPLVGPRAGPAGAGGQAAPTRSFADPPGRPGGAEVGAVLATSATAAGWLAWRRRYSSDGRRAARRS